MFLVRRVQRLLAVTARHPVVQRQTSACLHTTPVRQAKLFVDNENRYAHQILQNHDHYSVVRKQSDCDAVDSPISLEYLRVTDWSQLDDQRLVDDFGAIARFCAEQQLCISDKRFNAFVDALCERCAGLSDERLLRALHHLAHVPETDGLNTPNFVELWSCLDQTCVDRIQTWDFDQILLVCDHWYLLNLGKVNKFNWNAAKKIGRKLRKLPANQLVQTMFYTNLLRSPVVEMIDFEMNLVGCVDQLSLDEIAVMCMGFFKTQTQLRSQPLVERLYARLSAELDTVQDISLVNILKCLRYSSRIVHVPAMQSLLDQIEGQIPRLSLLSCLHVLLLGSDVQLCRARTVEACLQRFAGVPVVDIRLKDMERIAFVLGLFNYQSESGVADVLSERFLAELKNRVPEIMRYPRCLPACLQYLAFRGWSDAELLATVLDEQYCKHAYGRNVTLGRELFGLDSLAKIDLRDTYRGPFLQDRRRRQMGIILVHYIPARENGFKLSATDRILLDMKEATERAFGVCRLAHVLPHFDRPDLILAYDRRTGQALDLSARFPKQYYGGITWRTELLPADEPDSEHVVLFNLIVGGWNNYVRNEERLIGLIEHKRRQSRLIGYQPVIVPWHVWTRLTPDEQTIWIRNEIERELNMTKDAEKQM